MEHPIYFLVVSTLARYKRIELAIEACKALNLHLKVVGEGPDMKRLMRLGGPTIEFYGFRTGDELADLYRQAQATIFPGEEDFGLVPLESMACGTPVIAYAGGGALETVREGETGIFFREPTPEALTKVLRTFDRTKFDTETCRAHARNFSRTRFEKEIKERIQTLVQVNER